MDGWMDAGREGGMDGWREGGREGWMDMDGYGWMDGWMDGWMEGAAEMGSPDLEVVVGRKHGYSLVKTFVIQDFVRHLCCCRGVTTKGEAQQIIRWHWRFSVNHDNEHYKWCSRDRRDEMDAP